MRSASAGVLLALVAVSQFACGKMERQMAKTALASLCEGAADAAKKTADPAAAYKDLVDHYWTMWPRLRKGWAGIQLLETGSRYDILLGFARHDYGIEGWSCPALDHLLLRLVDRQGKTHEAESTTSPDAKPPYPIVRVAASGEVSIDGEIVALADLRESLARLYDERSHVVDFYREGWVKRMPPNSDAVLTQLVDQRFFICMCAKPDCPN